MTGILELLLPKEMVEADRLTIASGVSGYTLMLQAGTVVADAAAGMATAGDVLLLAGPGNNGGDAFIAAAELRRAGRNVRVASLGGRDALAGDAAQAARNYGGTVEELGPATDFSANLIVDGLFGAGLARPLDGLAAAAVEAVNASGRPVLAIDLPSGIDGRTGEVRGIAVRAQRTVTFFRLKPGHLLLPGRAHCGTTELAQVGIADTVLNSIRPSHFHNDPDLWRGALRQPGMDDHKYARGHAYVVSGPAHATGAARLAAAGALRIGAGVVTVLSPPDAVPVNAAQLTAIMVRSFSSVEDLARTLAGRRPNALVVGPGNGVGPRTLAIVHAALATDAGVVLDADALTSCADEPERLFKAIRARPKPVVLTPHEGEFGRLFKHDAARIDRAQSAARESGAFIVLKGPDTIISAPDGRCAISSNATPDLATAGSGDVLAGMIAGLLAQGVPGFEASCAAVWLHGAAGVAFGRGLIAEDLPAAIPAVLRQL